MAARSRVGLFLPATTTRRTVHEDVRSDVGVCVLSGQPAAILGDRMCGVCRSGSDSRLPREPVRAAQTSGKLRIRVSSIRCMRTSRHSPTGRTSGSTSIRS